MFDTPILIIVFNRLDTTQQVLAKIREVKPLYLYVSADGPREGNEVDKIKCENVRKFIIDNIDWKCEVKTLFQEKNLGCGLNPATAITWFFENVEQGIILEDDCLPSISFFNFCDNLLGKYKDQENIYMISGSNFQNKIYGKASYFFSEYGHIWGWATWRRAWKKFNYSIDNINEKRLQNNLQNIFSTNEQRAYSYTIFKKLKADFKNDIWDYQWHIAIWINNGISITPNKNLVTNIGFNNNGTHTLCEIQGVSNKKSESIEIIKHPIKIKIQREADKYLFYKTNLLRYNPPKKKITLKGFLSKLKNIFITNLKQLKIK